jgi:hypothetical protein
VSTIPSISHSPDQLVQRERAMPANREATAQRFQSLSYGIDPPALSVRNRSPNRQSPPLQALTKTSARIVRPSANEA